MPRRDPIALTSVVLTAVALIAFASNSVLCRIALGRGLIGPGLFTVVRLASGTAALGLLVSLRSRKSTGRTWSWPSALALVLYAAPFSYAYVRLSAGVGALILFAAVQITMIGSDLAGGATPHRREWLGLGIAVGGLAVLVAPGLNAPDPFAGVLMAVAGASWGVYSLRGRRSTDPVGATAGNFLIASVFALPLWIPSLTGASSAGARGLLLAAVSGAVSSGLGYAVWYAALRGLSGTRAAIAQLLVPLLAAIGGVLFLDESFTMRLFVAGTTIAVGVAVTMIRKD